MADYNLRGENDKPTELAMECSLRWLTPM